MDFSRRLFMAIATFMLSVIAYSATLPIALVDADLAEGLGLAVVLVGAVGVILLGAGAFASLAGDMSDPKPPGPR